jgi:3-oxoadipate enol-lactonase
MWLGIKHPERIDRLVLCNTSARIGNNELWEARIEAVNKEGMAGIATAVVSRWLTADFMARVPAKVELMRSMLVQTSAAGYVASCAALRDADLREGIRSIRAPTLVIAGMRDKSTPPQEGKLIAERIPGARYAELKAAHLSNWEVPQGFVTKIISFLTA